MWDLIVSIIKKYKVGTKIVLPEYSSSKWSPWFIIPTDGYGEVKDYGPFKLCELLQILIDPVEKKKTGQLVPDIEIDHAGEIVKELTENGVDCRLVESTIVIDL